MIVLTSNKILQLHQFLIQETGGLDGLRDAALLDSAVQSPLITFYGHFIPVMKKRRQSWVIRWQRITLLSTETNGLVSMRCSSSWM